jgi:hypothetical protein
MKVHDEPVLVEPFDLSVEQTGDPGVIVQIRGLLQEEPFAVLCTQGGRQPYGSLVAFAFSEDLLSECGRVALVVDNRSRHPDDMMQIGAVTVTGQAKQLDPGPEHDDCKALLTGRHPYLKTFVAAPSTALFRVEVVRFLHVTRFQEVRQWIPASNG